MCKILALAAMGMTPERSGITEVEKESVEELAAPRTRVIYEVVSRQGEEELGRPAGSLFWSGIAGGVTIMASVIAEGAIRLKLPPDAPMRELISDAGYSLGFLMVILARMQLFTEQTIVTVLPVMAEPTLTKLLNTARLWLIVFSANMIGAGLAAAIDVHLGLVSQNLLESMVEVSSAILRKTPLQLLLQAVPAGFLIASVAWIRAGITGSDFWIIFILTYAIALGDFTHVVAGSAEAFLLCFSGKVSFIYATTGIIFPALIGNVIGGTGLFALLAYAQVRREM
jgi:formate/nitrite transporter FocA (FNT family)